MKFCFNGNLSRSQLKVRKLAFLYIFFAQVMKTLEGNSQVNRNQYLCHFIRHFLKGKMPVYRLKAHPETIFWTTIFLCFYSWKWFHFSLGYCTYFYFLYPLHSWNVAYGKPFRTCQVLYPIRVISILPHSKMWDTISHKYRWIGLNEYINV